MANIDDKEEKGSPFDSVGLSGLTRYGPISRVYEEFLRELQGPEGMKSYREMRDNCPITGAILFAANHLCRKVSFQVVPKNNSTEAKKIAEYVGTMIFDDMDSTWADTLSEIMTMLTFGWALMEFRLKKRQGMDPSTRPLGAADNSAEVPQAPGDVKAPALNELHGGDQGYKVPSAAPSRYDDGLIGFRSWSLRAQESLFMWEFDEDSNAVVMQQMAPPDYRIRRIPLSKAFLFRTQVAKNNPEGRSILRNGWTSYYFKKNLQVFEGIGIERDLAGYPVIKIEPPDTMKGQAVPDIWNPKDTDASALLAQLQKMVRSVRRDEQEGMVLPWWADFQLLSTGSRRRQDTNDIISRYDQRIAMSVMADFIMLGHEAVGSKALAATKISLFSGSLSSFLDTACDITNRHAIPVLMKYNAWPMELMPEMTHGDVESVNLEELGNFIGKISDTGFNPLAGADAQKAIMEVAKLPTGDMVSDLGNNAQEQSTRRQPINAPRSTPGADVIKVQYTKLSDDMASMKESIQAIQKALGVAPVPSVTNVHVTTPDVHFEHHDGPHHTEVHPANIVVEPASITVINKDKPTKTRQTVERNDQDRIIATVTETIEE